MPKQTDSIELTNSLQGTVEYTASQEIIPEEKILEQGSFTYTSNGERTENPSEGYDGFSQVAVNVNVQPTLQEKSVSYTDNGDNIVEADDGYYGLSKVNVSVNVSGGGLPETPNDAVIFWSLYPFEITTINSLKNWDGAIYYSGDYSTWSEWSGTVAISATKNDVLYTVYMRGVGNSYLCGGGSGMGWKLSPVWVRCQGNLNNLLDYSTQPTLANYAFSNLFTNNKQTDFDVTLPATTLSQNCYNQMFQGCTSLVYAPDLPAQVGAIGCYSNMFNNCTSLVRAPSISLTTMAVASCVSMFKNCTALVNPPALPAEILASDCYSNMFYGCTSLVTAPALPATNIPQGAYQYMFYGCTSLVTAPALPAETLNGIQAYQYMFCGCTALVNPPALPATTVTDYCYNYMFYGCTSLVTAPALPAETVGTESYRYMFRGCTSLTTLVSLKSTTLKTRCYQNMFEGCSLIKLSTTQEGEYQTAYRIPSSDTGTTGNNSLGNMFSSTGGTFTGTPTINTTYYTSNTVIGGN